MESPLEMFVATEALPTMLMAVHTGATAGTTKWNAAIINVIGDVPVSKQGN